MHRFDRLDVSLARREVYLDGIPQPISMRAFDILELLIAADGGIVSKDAILAAVWPHAVVIDNNIQVHVSALRKLLGKAWIKTIAGRGYRLAAPDSVPVAVTEANHAAEAMQGIGATVGEVGAVTVMATPMAPVPQHPLSPTLQRVVRGPLLIGRESMLADLMERFSAEPFVTLLGPGGVGKTALAFAFARSWCERTGARLECLDLADVADPDDARKGDDRDAPHGANSIRGNHPRHWPDTAGRSGPVLLVLESCERDIDAAIALCQHAMAACPEMRVMATSREPLGMAGECLWRVGPLAVPGVHASDTEARRSPAVQLFMKRGRVLSAHENDAAFPIQMVASVCRLMDGLPLAIELAAQRAELIGLGALMTQLDASMLTLSNGVRGAPRRHRTLQSMLQWSYDMLSDFEQAVFRRLSLFEQAFTLGAACNAVSCNRLNGEDVFHALYGLVAKSLVRTESALPGEASGGGVGNRYGMLRSTRHFALDKLIEAGEANWLLHTKNVRLQAKFESIERAEGEAPGTLADWSGRRGTPWGTKPRPVSKSARDAGMSAASTDAASGAARFSHDGDMPLWYAA
ncbi:winged helix-turn-helix domain-containing protein [Robbsia sp. KACC 23696]|uniref:ATP-binding protein n=1 Tax=Robbsia sp. KACC 23696 TaxID=3149231 RepID=UPI00325AA888